MGRSLKDDARKAILARRARFVAAALAGVAATGAAVEALEACGGATDDGNQTLESPKPCLGKQYDPNDDFPSAGDGSVSDGSSDAAADASTDVSPKEDGSTPQPCLSLPPPDSSFLE